MIVGVYWKTLYYYHFLGLWSEPEMQDGRFVASDVHLCAETMELVSMRNF